MAEQPHIVKTEEVRDAYVMARDSVNEEWDNDAEFDRWLAAHDAQVLRDAAMTTRTDRFRIDEGISTAYADTFEAGRPKREAHAPRCR